MGEVEKARKDALELFRTINSFDDVKENREKMRDMIEGLFKAGAAELKRTLEESPDMGPEEAGKLAKQFQDDEFLMNKELSTELERIDSLPGVVDYIEQFTSEDEKRLEPVIEEFTKQMEKLMAIVMGGVEDMMQGMGDAMGEAIGQMKEGMKEEEEVEIPRGNSFKGDGVKFYGITCVNDVIDLSTWNYYKDRICDISKETISDDLGHLQTFKSFIIEDRTPLENFIEDIDMIEKKRFLLMEGIQKEMGRIATIPGASEEAIKIKYECLAQLGPIADEMDVLLKELRGL